MFDADRFRQEIATARSRRDIKLIWGRCLQDTHFCLLPRREREALCAVAEDAAHELPHDAEERQPGGDHPGIHSVQTENHH